MRARIGLALVAAIAVATGAPARAAPPARVVSINVCTDALLADLLPRERIASVTFLGADPRYSPRATVLAGIPTNRGGADEVLALAPDLVVAGRHAATTTTTLLERLGVPVLSVGLATSLDEARAQVLALAVGLGVPERGRALVARTDARLDALRPAAGARRPLAVFFRANGFTTGPRTLAGAVLDLVGFDNLAGRLGIDAWGMIGIEPLLLGRPEVVLLDGGRDSAPSLATAMLEHPALAPHPGRLRRASVPARLLDCAGPWVADAAEQLARVRAALP